MLLDLSISETREFWRNNPLIINGNKMTETSLFHLLWKADTYVPLEYGLAVFHNVSEYLSRNGYPLDEFLVKLIKTSCAEFIFPIDEVFNAIKPFLYNNVTTIDIRYLILLLLNNIYKKIIYHCTFHSIQHKETEHRNRDLFLITYDTSVTAKLYYDITRWKSIFLKLSPQIINIPVFEKVDLIADCRRIETVLDNTKTNYTITKGYLYIDKQKYGKEIDFNSFLKNEGICIKDRSIPSCTGVVIERDIFYPSENSCILKKKTFYGSPFYLLAVYYEKLIKSPENIYNCFLEKNYDQQLIHGKIASRHADMLQSCIQSPAFIYNKDHKIISIKGKRLASGTQASILRKIVYTYIYSKQKEFEYQEFIGDPGIFLDPLNPNLYIRIKRLSKKISEIYPPLKILQKGAGKFLFICDSEISLIEK